MTDQPPAGVAVGACDSAVRAPSAPIPMTPESVYKALLAELQRVQPICAQHGLNPEQTLELAAGLVLVQLQHTQPADVFRAMDLIDQAVAAIRHSRSIFDSRTQHLFRQDAAHQAGLD
ncbi:MAG: hypothetical protein ACRDYA_18045 [Egibacteraceae bacterium]